MQTTTTQNVFRMLLGAALFFAGISHMTFARDEFQAQVPDWIPVGKDLTVILSGVIEVSLGVGLLFVKKYRRQIGWATAIFFVLIFPGNIAQYLNKVNAFGLDSDAKRFTRLFFQPVLVVWAIWSTGAWRSRKSQD